MMMANNNVTRHYLDDPAIISRLFFPITAQIGSSIISNTYDGVIPVEDNVALSYRLYLPPEPECLIVNFHGARDLASDYDSLAPKYFAMNAALLVVDYRGYGWGAGQPLISTLLTDAEVVMNAIPNILRTAGQNTLPMFVTGRSLGSALAIHVAHKYPERFQGLIVVSGFVDLSSFFTNMGIITSLSKIDNLPADNISKIAEIDLPLLVIHGDSDWLLPVTYGQQLYGASPSKDRTMVVIPRAGHNDLMFLGLDAYFQAVLQFVRETLNTSITALQNRHIGFPVGLNGADTTM